VLGIHPIGQRALEAVLPGYGNDARYRRIVTNLRDAARYGITTIVEPQNGIDDLERFTAVKKEFDDDLLVGGEVAHRAG